MEEDHIHTDAGGTTIEIIWVSWVPKDLHEPFSRHNPKRILMRSESSEEQIYLIRKGWEINGNLKFPHRPYFKERWEFKLFWR